MQDKFTHQNPLMSIGKGSGKRGYSWSDDVIDQPAMLLKKLEEDNVSLGYSWSIHWQLLGPKG